MPERTAAQMLTASAFRDDLKAIRGAPSDVRIRVQCPKREADGSEHLRLKWGQNSPVAAIEANGNFSQKQPFGGANPDIARGNGWLAADSGRGCVKTGRRIIASSGHSPK